MAKAKKIILKRKDGLYLQKAGAKGHGVFCLTKIKKGEILEVTPAVILNEAGTKKADATILQNYTFAVGGVTRKLREKAQMVKPDYCSAAVFGALTMCNHADDNNAEIIWMEDGGALYYALTAIRDIPAGTEICTTYGNSWFSDRNGKAK